MKYTYGEVGTHSSSTPLVDFVTLDIKLENKVDTQHFRHFTTITRKKMCLLSII